MVLGSHMTEEQKSRVSVGHMGHTVSTETRVKMSVARKGKSSRQEGIHLSLETRAKMSLAQRERYSKSEERAKMSTAAQSGPLSIYWKGGKQISGRKRRARRRLLGFNPLNSWFPGCAGHHINKDDIIYMPHKLHLSVYHSPQTGKGMVEMNILAGAFLTEDWT